MLLTYRHVISINVVGTFVIVDGLQLESRMVIRKNVCEAILRPIAWQISKCARQVPADVLQLFKLFAETVQAYFRLFPKKTSFDNYAF